MTIKELERISKNESSASQYLLSRCIQRSPLRCPSCGFDRFYLIEKGKRRRCTRCSHSFSPFAGRWLHEAKIGCREWLWLVKLFELKTPATAAAKECSLSYPTVLRAFEIIRRAIAGIPEGKPGSCYGISSASSLETVSEKESAEESPEKNHIVLSMRVVDGCIVMTDKLLDEDNLLCCNKKLELVDRGKFFPRLTVYCNVKGFWPYAKEHLSRYHGVSIEKLPFYLAEVIFRWENKDEDLFELILERLCSYISESTPVETLHALKV